MTASTPPLAFETDRTSAAANAAGAGSATGVDAGATHAAAQAAADGAVSAAEVAEGAARSGDATAGAGAAATPRAPRAPFASGTTVEIRDELWLITNARPTADGQVLYARGVSHFVRNHEAVFYTALEDSIRTVRPEDVQVEPDDSPNYRRSRLWVEAQLRGTPLPLHDSQLSVAPHMLMDPLPYQLDAVRKTLSRDRLAPRVLIADAVGLGKTLEMGMILAELIRRGRGERILVVTPRQILEQFQQEMWSRFAIPLVRLDSAGIQQVRQKLPASRNPFTYFPKVIVSIDTLKSAKYRAQLREVSWDAVLIDEIHNATNASSQNYSLASILAETTNALILASATPHNGDTKAFKNLLRLLDPTAINARGELVPEVVDNLIIRRHRNSPEVRDFVGQRWAQREEPRHIAVPASPEENAVANELAATWLGPDTAAADPLFGWTLVKSFLSSPAALERSIKNRLARKHGRRGASTPQAPHQEATPAPAQPGAPTAHGAREHQHTTPAHREEAALLRLRELNNRTTPQKSAKYRALVEYLREIGVKKGSDTRVVVFSEAVETLHWLRAALLKDLKLGSQDAVQVMHGQLGDQEQMHLINEFKRQDSKLRVLVTSDVSSEGVNLHALCHHLVHYDIPWSLIRIQQRNGRIDRYGQMHRPQITTLLLDPANPEAVGELRVLERLVQREHEAHKVLGDATALMGKHSTALEEHAIRSVLRGEKSFDATVAKPEELVAGTAAHADLVDKLLAQLGAQMTAPAAGPGAQVGADVSLYGSQLDYVNDALHQRYADPSAAPAAGGVGWRVPDKDTAELEPPAELRRRLDFLPQDYVRDRRVKARLLLATTQERGRERLEAARRGEDNSSWPSAHYLGPLHPVTQWAQEAALATMGRETIPAISGAVEAATVLCMAVLSNEQGEVVSRVLFAVDDIAAQALPDPVGWLRAAGLSTDAVNTGQTVVPEGINDVVRQALRECEQNIEATLLPAARAQVDATISALNPAYPQDTAAKLRRALLPTQRAIRPLLVVLPAGASAAGAGAAPGPAGAASAGTTMTSTAAPANPAPSPTASH